ncbi:MAG: GNAT family protein [Methanofollis sp.]|uniref:GNAT family N-acetyltransferase n=1 Tax=Methanofollis sp. TaxID=2052835 RepID=UPI00260DF7E6|nr:GNAT family protein [Methanofollis sp.]MDD4255965.1 GNAT family protein [Methanofollis sp.]
MTVQPTLRTAHLLLAPFRFSDAPEIARLADDPAIADTAVRMPYPYPQGMATAWIAASIAGWANGRCAVWKIVRAGDGVLIGSVGLTIDPANRNAELGYWIRTDAWGRGYATEVAVAAVAFAFGPLGLHRVHASCLRRNPASARVLEKAGLRLEGCRRGHLFHRGRFEDVLKYGVVEGDLRPSRDEEGKEPRAPGNPGPRRYLETADL